QYNATKTGRLARYTAVGDTASPTSEVVILGSVVGSSCNNFPEGADCIPSDSPSHSVGNVKFAPDGSLFVTLGDGAHFNNVDNNALRTQNLDLLSGKVLRITPDGAGVPGNPFWTGEASANRSKVWAYGLRNPYRFNLRPGAGSGLPYIGDVGWNRWEEINVAAAGVNLGWPCYEGNAIQSGYEPKSVCQALYAQGSSAVRFGLVVWDHAGTSSAATGGAFYTGTAYPSPYQGAYFYGDYSRSWMRSLRVDASDNLIAGSDAQFATGADGPVDIEMGPDQNLYYLAINRNELRRIRYVSGSNTPPTADASANPTSGLAPLAVQFSSVGSNDPNGDPLDYTWNFGDGSATSALPNPQHTYSANGPYTATLTVDDGRGGTSDDSVTIVVGNEAPVVTITAPSASLTYKVGDVITFAGSATDAEDGTIGGAGLAWEVIIQHCPGGLCHVHTLTTGSGSGGSFTIPDHGDESYFEIRLTATDSAGLTDTTSVAIQPQTVQITLATAPQGLQVVYDGTSGPAPLTRTTIVGSAHTIHAPSPQGSATFASWSDGGAQQHNVTVGETDVTYTANFDGPVTVTFDDLADQDEPLNGTYPSGVIDWGATSKWWHSSPWGTFTTKSISFNGLDNPGITSASFAFVTPRRLVSLRAYNGGGGASTVTLSCPGQSNKVASVAAGQVATIQTGWTGTCSTVTLSSSNGWNTNFDDLVHDAGPAPASTATPTATVAPSTATATPSPTPTPMSSTATPTSTPTGPTATPTASPTPTQTPTVTSTPTATNTPAPPTATSTATPTTTVQTQTVTFNDKAGQNQVLNGQYPAGVIDWGSDQWYHSGPWGSFTTKSVSFNGGGATSASFEFVTPRRLVSLRAYNGGGSTSTVTLSCVGQPQKQVSVAAGQVTTIQTGWTGTCSTVTLGSSNGWDTNFDDLVIDGG
ncbi:MAG: PQQ-dependent sugar dehydrogenase, partial [Chloroflexota bacterium]